MLDPKSVKFYKKHGYIRIPNFVVSEDLKNIINYIPTLENVYTEENLLSRKVYLSDKSENRVSHAQMVSLEPSELPSLSPPTTGIFNLLYSTKMILSELFSRSIPDNSRYLVNFQAYKSGSKPVPEHYDGEYIRYQKLGDYEFKIKEALIPQHVFVVTLYNKDLEERGTAITEIKTGKRFYPISAPGDLLLFDNIRFRHSVPELSSSRAIIGVRNFDFYPYHFIDKYIEGYDELPDDYNPGYIDLINDEEAQSILKKFLRDIWPQQYQEAKKQGAVF